MFTLLAYPLDVIKTNRLLDTSFAKKTGGNLSQELNVLYERGGLSRGFYRGFGAYFLGHLIYSNVPLKIPHSSSDSIANDGLITALTVALNPLSVLNVQR
jgi:hypothetical protein